MGGNQWRRRESPPPGGPSVRPGRTGAAWARCRRVVIAAAGGRCAICRGSLNLQAARWADDSTEVDHYPDPLWRLEEMYSGADFERAANDPSRCRAVHRRCHKLGRPAFDSAPEERSPLARSLDTISIG